ncbi:hypothetical protein J1C56_12120 [Aminobacter anthyllidis]|uniref:Uncharacterized protein n=1 Tax=Aminobacter anthyllidis TaxID=1035067 RepID=A0A9X1AAK1_9HYPH|nr:hypothetical protein [Aminobacter anthyllidis]MBT1156338.1 hypothetical protein [Aminobacter anthyllidis]
MNVMTREASLALSPALRLPPLARDSRASTVSFALSLTCLCLAFALWLVVLFITDPAGVDDYGLISVLPGIIWAAYAAVGLGFAFSLKRGVCETRMPLLMIVMLVLLLHGTSAIVYDELRYAWAWKHVGVVDYVQRHGQIDPKAPFLAAYANWPGLFVVSAAIANLFDIKPIQLAEIARFSPPALNLLYVLVLPQIYRRFTADPRLVWGGVWVFVIGNWIGQDYFSPQGVAFLFYLMLIALCVGPLRISPAWADPCGRGLSRLCGRYFAFVSRGQPPATLAIQSYVRVAASVAAMALIVMITATHPLTPIVVLMALGGLWVIGQLSLGYLVFAGLVEVAWLLFYADGYMASILPELVQRFGDTSNEISERLVDTSIVSEGQVVVSWASRALTGAVALAAVLGGLRRLVAGYRDGPAIVLTLAPAFMVVATSYGGEIVFRVYLFALPFLAFFAAALFFPWSGTQRDAIARFAIGLFGAALSVAFVLANNGKDRQYTFSQAEVQASEWLYRNAPAGSVLVEGAPNYPEQFMNYENFTYVPISNESRQSIAAVLADPAAELGDWLRAVPAGSAFIIITRSQKAYIDDLGVMPKGSLDAIEKALRDSARFRLVRATADASVFAPNDQGIGMGEWIE